MNTWLIVCYMSNLTNMCMYWRDYNAIHFTNIEVVDLSSQCIQLIQNKMCAFLKYCATLYQHCGKTKQKNGQSLQLVDLKQEWNITMVIYCLREVLHFITQISYSVKLYWSVSPSVHAYINSRT